MSEQPPRIDSGDAKKEREAEFDRAHKEWKEANLKAVGQSVMYASVLAGAYFLADRVRPGALAELGTPEQLGWWMRGLVASHFLGSHLFSWIDRRKRAT